MKKRILSLLLAVTACVTLAAPALAAQEATLTELAVYDCDGTVHPFYQGVAKLMTKDGWIFVDQQGKEIMECAYDQVSNLSDGLVRFYGDNDVYRSGGYINTAGKEVIKFEGPYILGCFSEGLAEVGMEGGSYGFIDTTGEFVIPREYQAARSFSEGLAAVKQGGKWGYIDKNGQMVIPAQYEKAKEFCEGLAPVQKDGKCGYIDKNGEVVVPFQYDWIENQRVSAWAYSQDTNISQRGCFFEGMAMVMRDKKYGFIDKNGKEVVELKYETARNFSDGMALVNDRNYVDKAGVELSQSGYWNWFNAGDFCDGLAYVCNSMTMTSDLINKRGEVVWSGDLGDAYYSGGVLFVLEGEGVHTDKMRLYAVSVPEEPGITQTTETKTGPAANTAYASTQSVLVDGKSVEFQCYALKDANGNATNYIKLRDLAMLLSGTAAQFQVGWDGSVTITTKTAYTPNGSELSTPYSGDRAYCEANAATKVNGQSVDLAAFVLNDDDGGGYTYYQLRDLGKALGFNVGWSADKGIFVETDRPYDYNN